MSKKPAVSIVGKGKIYASTLAMRRSDMAAEAKEMGLPPEQVKQIEQMPLGHVAIELALHKLVEMAAEFTGTHACKQGVLVSLIVGPDGSTDSQRVVSAITELPDAQMREELIAKFDDTHIAVDNPVLGKTGRVH